MSARKIYITGKSCKLPMSDSVGDFSNSLFEKKNCVRTIPTDRWESSWFVHPVPGTPGKSYSFSAGIIDGLWDFDPRVFGISPREANTMDPQQRILLQLTWEALEDAGITPKALAGRNVGVYVGCSSMDYGRRLAQGQRNISDPYLMTGNTLSLVSNRLSYAFDLHGPSMTVDTACSSSLLALQLAYKALRHGEVDTAIVGGVNVLLAPDSFSGFSAAHMLSPTGACKAFADGADGYVRAEGGVVLVLQNSNSMRLTGADPVAEVVSVATNTDGKTSGVALPSFEYQEKLLSRTYQQSGIDPRDLLFVEAHGTGTNVGDPIEAEALGRAVASHRDDPLPIGSVKTNIGHLEPASGLAGVLKSVIALENRKLPPSLYSESPSPHIKFDELNLWLPSEPVDLDITPTKRFAGISSFGFGGVNVHAIIAAPNNMVSIPAKPKNKKPVFRGDPLLTISAYSSKSLETLATEYADLCDSNTGLNESELCLAARTKRGQFPHRLGIAGDNGASLSSLLRKFSRGESDPRILAAHCSLSDEQPVFVFSGNGSQFPGMSIAALAADAAYRKKYEEASRHYEKISGQSLLDLVVDENLDEKIRQADVSQPLMFADQIALAHALRERGLHPAAVLGHSGGEVAAAYCSGALDLEQALRVIHVRSQTQIPLFKRGTMAAVQAAEDEVKSALLEFPNKSLAVAAVNSPKSVSVSGSVREVQDFVKWARKNKRWAGVNLKIDYPYHNALQDQIESAVRDGLKDLSPASPELPFFSSVSGELIQGPDLNADYWWRSVRNPVQFTTAVSSAVGEGYRLFVECGAQPVLVSYLKSCLREENGEYASVHTLDSIDYGDSNPVVLSLCRAVVNGASVDENKIFGKSKKTSVKLPGYSWDMNEYRSDLHDEIQIIAKPVGRSRVGLGVQGYPNTKTWSRTMDAHNQPLFAKHVMGNRSILPATVFLDMALSAGEFFSGDNTLEIRDLDIVAPLVLSETAIREVKTDVITEDMVITVSSRLLPNDETWIPHLQCRYSEIDRSEAGKKEAPASDRGETDFTGKRIYEFAEGLGMLYGQEFQLVSHFRRPDRRSVEVVLSDARPESECLKERILDVLGADAVLHGLLAALMQELQFDIDLGFVPIRMGKVRLYKKQSLIKSGRIFVKRIGKQTVVADIDYFDGNGELILAISGARFRAVRLADRISLPEHSYNVEAQALFDFSRNQPGISLSTSKIAMMLERKSNEIEFDPMDDSDLVIEAVAQTIIHEALSQFADENGSFQYPPSTLEGKSGLAKRRYLERLLRSISRSGLSECTAKGWNLVSDQDAASSDKLIQLLVSENPERAVECRLLARMKSALPEMLTGEIEWDPVEIFGRGAIFSHSHVGIGLQRRLELLKLCVEELCAQHGEPGPIRIGELTGNASLMNTPLSRLQPYEHARLFMFVDGELPSEDFVGKDIRVLSASRESFSQCGGLDLLIVPEGLFGYENTASLMETIQETMSPGGVILSLEEVGNSYNDLVGGIFDGGFQNPGDSPLANDKYMNVGEKVSRLEKAGYKDVALGRLSDGFSGINCVVAKAGSPDEDTGEFPPSPVLAEVIEKLASQISAAGNPGDVPTGHYHKDEQVWTFDSGEPELPESGNKRHLVAYFPENLLLTEELEVLEKRLLLLANQLESLNGQPATCLALVPNGANCAGSVDVVPGQAAVWNFLRTASNEYPNCKIRCVDALLNEKNASIHRHVSTALLMFPDETELVLRGSVISGLRIKNDITQKSANTKPHDLGRKHRVMLEAPPGASLEELRWEMSDREKPGANQLEIRVEAAGLNYRDVMWAMGRLPEEALENGFAGASLGMECAGTVEKVGAGVTDYKKGDKVIAIGKSCLSSHVTVDVANCVPLSFPIKPQAAATLPVTYFTAYYSLRHLGKIAEGDVVLIHGAAGGVGLAAIQVAQHFGAQVIVTAGSPDKQNLLQCLGIEHVLNSRKLDFVDEVHEITNGNGVDIVLNSLAGEAMERSIECLKPFGRFIELGKQDYYTNTRIGLRPFKENIRYFGVDVDQLLANDDRIANDLFDEIMDLVSQGAVNPIPYSEFRGDHAVDAFKYLQRSAHIGKIIVRPDKIQSVPDVPNADTFRANENGAHIIFGGTSGFGFETACWLAERGARHIVLASRSNNPSQDILDRIGSLRSAGLRIDHFSCDVTSRDDLRKFLADIKAESPICGVVNAAMQLHDTEIANLDDELLRNSLSAKVSGSAFLDELTRTDKLDYFILYSSIAALVGNPQQSAYVAANAYMEALARRRISEGLPALSIGWGAISDVGYLTRNKELSGMIRKMSGDVEFTSGQALASLGKILSLDAQNSVDPVVYVTPMKWGHAAKYFRTMSSPTYWKLAQLGANSGSFHAETDLRSQLVGLSQSEAENKLVEYIVKELSHILKIPIGEISENRPLTELGMDSLMGVEFLMSAEKALGDDIPQMTISSGATVRDMARKISVWVTSGQPAAETEPSTLNTLMSKHTPTSGKDSGIEAMKDTVAGIDEHLDRMVK